jgi:hypothetical protein
MTAEKAQEISSLREMRHQEAYDKVLRRCLEHITETCPYKPATVYVVPKQLSLEVIPYFLDNLVNYLIVALRRDYNYQVIRVTRHALYIRWLPLDMERRSVERQIAQEAAQDFGEPPRLLKKTAAAPLMSTTFSRPATTRKSGKTMTIDLAAEMAEIDAAMAKLNV